MLFNSLHFLAFFPIVTLLFFMLKNNFRIFWLLLASCYFYAFFIPKYLLILFLIIVIDYISGICIEKTESSRKKTIYLSISIVTNLAVLFFFKYYNFFADNLNWLSQKSSGVAIAPHIDMILPIGLSFHTFQAMSYTIEVYRGKQAAERNFMIYALYVMFYPQLVAGPIERPQNLLPQFHRVTKFSWTNLQLGIELIAWGLLKKVIIADRLTIYVDKVFGAPSGFQGLPVLVAVYFFAIQIYCDFSGYSDIARGSAKVMGYELMENFNHPYFSKSIQEFWRRWHCSLSTWFKDYLYIPLGGHEKFIRNILIVFLVSGLWHGANWTFVIWGAYHGLLLVLYNSTKLLKLNSSPYLPKDLMANLSRFVTFNLVCFGWIFFRAENLSSATSIIKGLLSKQQWRLKNFIQTVEAGKLGLDLPEFSVGVLSIALLLVCEILIFNRKASTSKPHFPHFARATLLYISILLLILFGKFSQNSFIYFQF